MYPILFHYELIEIYTSTVMVFLGLIVFGISLQKRVKSNMLSINFINDHFFPLVFLFILFGRLGEVFLRGDVYEDRIINVLYIWDGNFSFQLGLIGIFLGLSFFALFKKEKYFKWFDVFIYPFVYFSLFLSAANLSSGRDYGEPSDLPFALTFNVPEVRYTTPVHPVQIYEFLGVFLILMVLFYIGRKKRTPGVLGLTGFFLYYVLELVLQFYRSSNDVTFFDIKFHTLLFTSMIIILLIALIIRSHRNFHLY